MRRLVPIIVSVGMVAGACAAPGRATDDVSSPAPIEDALAFSATTVDGDVIDMGQFAGQDVLLWFWAPW